MSTDRRICPYCGEEIIASAKKCRFCGEWLEAEPSIDESKVDYIPQFGEQSTIGLPDSLPTETQLPASPIEATRQYANNQPVNANASSATQTRQPVVVVNNNILQQTTVSQQQEVVVVKKKTSSGWLFAEIIAVSIGVWIGVGTWWAGLIAFFVMAILMQIPVISTIMCIILGCGVGLFAGAIAYGFDAPNWLCWVIGIIVAIVISGINMEDRDAETED